MSDPFIGEIRIMACNFPPMGWALCNGQVLNIQQNQALFAVIGATYGGNGQTTFALPNLAGRAPLHRGQGPGLSMNHSIGEATGSVGVTLAPNQIPSHTHAFNGIPAAGKQTSAVGALVAEQAVPSGSRPVVKSAYTDAAANATLSAGALTASGAAAPSAHQNCQPYQILNFVIALEGVFPPRS